MGERARRGSGDPGAEFSRRVGEKAARRIRARRERDGSVWFWLGMFGLVGWSVAVPTLAAVAAGLWLDRHRPAPFSWTLTLLVVGVALGCLNAWHWIQRVHKGP